MFISKKIKKVTPRPTMQTTEVVKVSEVKTSEVKKSVKTTKKEIPVVVEETPKEENNQE